MTAIIAISVRESIVALSLAAFVGALTAGGLALVGAWLDRRARRLQAEHDREHAQHDQLVAACAAYFEAMEGFIRVTLDTPPRLVVEVEEYWQQRDPPDPGMLARIAIGLGLRPPFDADFFDATGSRRQTVEDSFYGANARLHIVESRELSDIQREVEKFVMRWQEGPGIERVVEWRDKLRPHVVAALQEASWAPKQRESSSSRPPP